MTMWLLDDDDLVVQESEQVQPGDVILRRSGDEVLRVGVAALEDKDPVDWRTELDLTKVPERDLLAKLDNRTPLQRLENAEPIERAVDGVLTAERNRDA